MMAPLNFSTPAAKPKIGFSIDSIVGDDSPADGGKPARVSAASRVSPSPRSPRSPDGSPRCSPVSAAGWSPAGRARSPLRSRSPVWPRAAAAGRPRSPPPLDMEQAKLAAFHHLHSMQQLHSLQHRLHAPEPLHPAALRTPVPGLPGFGLGPLGLARPAVSVASGQPLPPAFGPPHLGGGLPPQTEYPLLPWLYSRQGRLFPSRFPGPEFPAFLLQPFRKPKRIRTAFSPSQLLKLEHAFENNHYVVGQERKQLAQALNLSETQVKVWFQNRRTKHKRVQDEEGGPTKSPGAAPAAADAADEQTDSLLTYEESDEENIDVDAADKPEEP